MLFETPIIKKHHKSITMELNFMLTFEKLNNTFLYRHCSSKDLKQELPYKRSLDPKISTDRADVLD